MSRGPYSGGLAWLWRLTHPAALLPTGILVVALVSRYDSLDIGHKQSIPLFMQGSTDWGGSITFASTMALYAVCGTMAAVQLALWLELQPPASRFGERLRGGAWRLSFYWICFVVGGLGSWSYDRWVGPNDFRNMFLLAALVFVASTAWVTWLSRLSIPRLARVLAAPCVIALWLFVGSDGTTAKAGQVLDAGVNPQETPRGLRHGIMLSWHRLCDGVLGDVAEPSGGSAVATR